MGKSVFLKFLNGKLSAEEAKREAEAMQLKLPREFLTARVRLLPMDGGMEANGMARDILRAFREKFILCAEQAMDELILLLPAGGAYRCV